MAFIGILLITIGLFSLLPVIPIPGLMHLSVALKGIGRFSGPAGFVLIVLGAILWGLGF